MNSPDRLQDLKKQWDEAGRTDPFWAVLSRPDKTGKRWAADEFFETGKEEIAKVMADARRLGTVGTARALDFGCGPGRLTQALVQYFDHVDGADISPSMIDLAGKLNQFPERCTYHLNTASDLKSFDDSAFDFVYSNITLQHVGPVYAKNYIREFVRVLRGGGLMIFQLPGHKTGKRSRIAPFIPGFVMGLYRRLRYKNHPAASMDGIPRQELVPFIESLGAQVLDVEANDAAGDGWESFRYSCRRVP